MADSAERCAHCNKPGAGFKRCSRCKQACYCGAACQKADWKRHMTTCAPPVPLQDVAVKLDEARAADDWRGVLKWEGRMEELMAHQSDDFCSGILSVFSDVHQLGWQATGSDDHALSCVGLVERRIPLLASCSASGTKARPCASFQASFAHSKGRAKPRPGISGHATSVQRTGFSR